MNRAPASGPVRPWALAVVAMLSVQLASALSVHLIAAVVRPAPLAQAQHGSPDLPGAGPAPAALDYAAVMSQEAAVR